MRKYSQLTQEQRYQIYAFLKINFSISDIAKEIGVHKSTISRELKRNKGKKGYRPKQANIKAYNRRSNAFKFIKLTPDLVNKINNLIQHEFSPEKAMKQFTNISSTIKSMAALYTSICAALIKNIKNVMVSTIAGVKSLIVSVSTSAQPSLIQKNV